jgi:uncharacterized Tic20 family protein
MLSPSDERTWAMLAHLSVLANLVTGALGPIIALIIFFVYKDRSRYVADQSMQAFLFQLIWWVGGGIVAGTAFALSGIFSVVLIGILCLPIACLLSLVPVGSLIYGVVGAIQASQGQDFEYWLVGDWAKQILDAK